MCLICYKPVGSALPSRKILKASIKNNPHGTGFMIAKDGKVHIRKGFFKYGTMKQELDKMLSKWGIDAEKLPIVIHSRIATSGKINRGNTHPFPLKPDESMLTKTSLMCLVGVAHNGVISSTSGCLSDTQEFIRDTLSKSTFSQLKEVTSREHIDVSNRIRNDRLIVMNGEGDVVKFGNWFDDKGLFWSNYTFRKTVYGTDWYKKTEVLPTVNLPVNDYTGMRQHNEYARPRQFESGEPKITGMKWGTCDMCDDDRYLQIVHGIECQLCWGCFQKLLHCRTDKDISFLRKVHVTACCSACKEKKQLRWMNGEGYICIACYYMFSIYEKHAGRTEILNIIQKGKVLNLTTPTTIDLINKQKSTALVPYNEDYAKKVEDGQHLMEQLSLLNEYPWSNYNEEIPF